MLVSSQFGLYPIPIIWTKVIVKGMKLFEKMTTTIHDVIFYQADLQETELSR